MDVKRGDFLLSDDKSRLDYDAIHRFLSNAYWALGRSKEDVIESCNNSFCFAIYHSSNLIGFARIVSDKIAFAYLMDVYIIPEYRGKGLSKWMLSEILNYPEFKKVKGWMLATKDAHQLYEKFGFTILKNDNKYMIRNN